jgi:hypothetical protein
MTVDEVLLTIVITFTASGFLGIIVVARTYLRSPRVPTDFPTLFCHGWFSAGLLTLGTVDLVQIFVLRWPLYPVNFWSFFVFFAVGVFVSWLVGRRYRRTISHPDFAEDESGNPIPAATPEVLPDGTMKGRP